MGLLHRQVRVAPEDDLSCSGWIIPRGTAVSMTNHWMHLDPTVFPDPHAFKPERWLGDPEMMRVMHEYCVPFSKGSRGCMAKKYVFPSFIYPHSFLSGRTYTDD